MLRLAQILYILSVSLVFNYKKSVGEGLRIALERLGLVFVKIGQMLAARQLFSAATQLELQKLRDSTRPLSLAVIKPIVEQALGEPIDSYFDSFDETAYASASIAQTHIAYLHGRKVIVKVRRPNVLRNMRSDMRIARQLIWLGSFVSERMKSIRTARIPEQVEMWLHEESDLRVEARNAELFRAAYSSDRIIIPKVWFASEEVLIEEFLEGIPCNRWNERENTNYRALGYDPQASVKSFIKSLFGPPLLGISVPIHGDPHPANIIIMSRGRMGIVDFGRVVVVSEETLEKLMDVMFAIYASDSEQVVEALLRLGNYTFKSDTKRRAFEQDIAQYVRKCQSSQS